MPSPKLVRTGLKFKFRFSDPKHNGTSKRSWKMEVKGKFILVQEMLKSMHGLFHYMDFP